MNNDQKHFMKNRPVAEKANQYKDVYSNTTSSTREVLTVIFSVIMLLCAVVCFAKGHIVPALVFVFILVLLLISVFVSARAPKIMYNPDDNKDAIFKDHDE